MPRLFRQRFFVALPCLLFTFFCIHMYLLAFDTMTSQISPFPQAQLAKRDIVQETKLHTDTPKTTKQVVSIQEVSYSRCEDIWRPDAYEYTVAQYLDCEALPVFPAAEPDAIDVTLVVHATLPRLSLMSNMLYDWSGPISLAVWVPADQVQSVFSTVCPMLKTRGNVLLSVVSYTRYLPFYPMNILRNIAIDGATTSHVFLVDVDFRMPRPTYPTLLRWIATEPERLDGRTSAYVVPAFEARQELQVFPQNKNDLLLQLYDKLVKPVKYDVWKPGHARTNYSQWILKSQPYDTRWQMDYEPYVAVEKKNLPRFDTRFVGFGFDKASHSMLLAARNYVFRVLPNVFIVHMPHPPTKDAAVHNDMKSLFRRCVKRLRELFKAEILKFINPKLKMN